MSILPLKNISSTICDEFYKILKNKTLRTVLQPIISLRDGSILGYEALSRGPKGTNLEMPAQLFEIAEYCDALWDLELLCRTQAIKRIKQLELKTKLFINVSPNIINDNKFKYGFTKSFILKNNINPNNIIFEITERYAVSNIEDFQKTIKHYKEQHYKIAIDDAGSGYSGLSLIADIEPHYIKLDMNLIRNIDTDLTKQAIVKGMAEFAKLTNTQIIAEGIERKAELTTLINIGINYGQGFYIQKPKERVMPIPKDVLEVVKQANSVKNKVYGYKITNIFIENICSKSITVNPKVPIKKIDHIFKNNPNLPEFCVIDGNEILGVVTKKKYYTTLSGRYGYSLYSNKSICNIMNKDFLSVHHDTPIDVVAKQAMGRPEDTLYDFITVTKDSNYLGIVTVRDLITKAIEVEVTNAKHLNPLSELPGNIIIEQCLNSCINSTDPYCAFYIDIDNFKAYNDVYGFEKGDQIIKMLANVLEEQIPSSEFIGHIGGDDFVVVIKGLASSDLCQNIIDKFSNITQKYYTDEDLRNGYLIAKNRHGIPESFPLLSLSIAGVTNLMSCYKTVYELSEKASKLKSECKRHSGSYFIIE